jgi:hypothetical protein
MALWREVQTVTGVPRQRYRAGENGTREQGDAILFTCLSLDPAIRVLKRQQRQLEHQDPTILRSNRGKQRTQVRVEPGRRRASQEIIPAELDKQGGWTRGNGTRL